MYDLCEWIYCIVQIRSGCKATSSLGAYAEISTAVSGSADISCYARAAVGGNLFMQGCILPVHDPSE